MALTIKLNKTPSPKLEQWLAKNVGQRLHYIHNSIGGEGWLLKKSSEEYTYFTIDGDEFKGTKTAWSLTLEDERFASWFRIMFPDD